MTSIDEIIIKQREFFNSGHTNSYDFRIRQLKLLKKMLLENEESIYDALYKDLNK